MEGAKPLRGVIHGINLSYRSQSSAEKYALHLRPLAGLRLSTLEPTDKV